MTIWAIVPAAGIGRRMGPIKNPNHAPKQYLPINGIPVLIHSLRKLLTVPDLGKVVVVLHPEDRYFAELDLATDARIVTTSGGDERQISVLNGLEKLVEARDDDWVLVHDAVRPCVEPGDILNLINALIDHPVGGLLGARLDNTLKEVDEGDAIKTTVDRSRYWNALTPQLFRFAVLRRALKQARANGLAVTDEAAAIEALGLQPQMVPGDKHNIKITHQSDLALAELILDAQGVMP